MEGLKVEANPGSAHGSAEAMRRRRAAEDRDEKWMRSLKETERKVNDQSSESWV